MKICSFLPSATEILFALGLGDQIVGVSHECDFPPEASRKPRVISTIVDQQLSSAEIDRLVLEHVQRRESLYRVEVELLSRLRPDLIVTQELCEVCAIDAKDVLGALRTLSFRPRILSLHPHTLSEVLDEILIIGEETQRAREATQLVRMLKARIERVRQLGSRASTRPRVFCLEWLAPPMASGHWVPEMVELAGGCEVLGHAGKPSRSVTWADIGHARPEMLFIMPCGFPIERTKRELSVLGHSPGWDELEAVKRNHVYLVNGPAYYNCSGPRLVDGLEIFAGLLHPERAQGMIPAGAVERLEMASLAGRGGRASAG